MEATERKKCGVIAGIIWVALAVCVQIANGKQVPFLDQTPTRVQSALNPDLRKIGTLIPKSVPEIETSMWSLGCETLDRDLASWDVYREYLVPLGIKRIRLQGGWSRTEQVKGVYDFAWLDRIIDDAISLGLEVCLETSYNNPVYNPNVRVGPSGWLPKGEEALAAWDRWVEALARRYTPKGVNQWMMYNEPDNRLTPPLRIDPAVPFELNTPGEIADFNIRTAEIIKRVDPEARIGAFVISKLYLDMIEDLLMRVKQAGKTDLFHWVVYHGYGPNPDALNDHMKDLIALLERLAPDLKPWQGEAGGASEAVQFALSGINWTEYSHAKWNTRRMLCDFGMGIDSTVFTISDLSYYKDFVSRYGLLKTNPDNSLIKVKSAYYAVQNVVSLFNESLVRLPDYDVEVTGTEKELSLFAFRDRTSGLDVIAFWEGTEMPSNNSDIEIVQLTVKNGQFNDPVWIDLITGNVYEIPQGNISVANGAVTIKDIPVYDGPGVVADKSILSYVPVRERKR